MPAFTEESLSKLSNPDLVALSVSSESKWIQ